MQQSLDLVGIRISDRDNKAVLCEAIWDDLKITSGKDGPVKFNPNKEKFKVAVVFLVAEASDVPVPYCLK